MLRQNKAYVAVALTHFTVDVLNNSRTLLIAILALSLGLSNAQVALVALLYNVGSAVMQPLFGWLADRFGARWLVLGGIGWMILFYGLAALAGDWLALVALTVAGVGSGAFHPTGTMVASQASTTRRTQATAYFFTAGQLGLFLGPVFAGILLQLRAVQVSFSCPCWPSSSSSSTGAGSHPPRRPTDTTMPHPPPPAPAPRRAAFWRSSSS